MNIRAYALRIDVVAGILPHSRKGIYLGQPSGRAPVYTHVLNRGRLGVLSPADSVEKKNVFPAGWNEARVRAVLQHYEEQTDDEAVAEDEAAFRARGQTVMVVPKRLVPAITKLITREETIALKKRPNKGLQPSASRVKTSAGSKALSRSRRLKP